jgi:hypothetical protein
VDGLTAIVGGILSTVVYGMLFAGVYKLFAISTDLAEIKEHLKRGATAGQDPFLAAHQAALQEPREWTVLEKEN